MKNDSSWCYELHRFLQIYKIRDIKIENFRWYQLVERGPEMKRRFNATLDTEQYKRCIN